VFLGASAVIGIILLLVRSRPVAKRFQDEPLPPPSKLFAQVIAEALPRVLQIWEHGDTLLPKEGLKCPSEISFDPGLGRSYFNCQPHLWQCYWEGGVVEYPLIKIDIFGQTFHVAARGSFPSIPAYSEKERFYQMIKRPGSGIQLSYGYVIDLEVREIPGLTQPLILADTCRDTYLPQRIYGLGSTPKKKEDEFLWDNFGRDLFIDRFYVSNQQVNEWRVLSGEMSRIVSDRKLWYQPAILSLSEQKKYCSYFGKHVLEARYFDAAAMAPIDQKDPMPTKVAYPQTPWQRDLSKSFLGMARINPDYQLSPLDCQLAQVEGCSAHRFYTTDSASWMGMNYPLGFYPESLPNSVDPKKNLKLSSKFLPASSEWHELGRRTIWNGEQGNEISPVAFRCYEEVIL
jgi:hypothetical protein